jgi:hypothetical protein
MTLVFYPERNGWLPFAGPSGSARSGPPSQALRGMVTNRLLLSLRNCPDSLPITLTDF